MSVTLATLFLLAGTAFTLIAAIGLLRLPDLYTRMHAVTKAGTLGIGLILVGAAVSFGDLSVTTRAVAVFLFVLFTAPVSAHMIGRAGYLGGVSLWGATKFDQWEADYNSMRREGMEADGVSEDGTTQADA